MRRTEIKKFYFQRSIDKLNELQMMQAISQHSPIELVKNRIYNTKIMCQKLNLSVIKSINKYAKNVNYLIDFFEGC